MKEQQSEDEDQSEAGSSIPNSDLNSSEEIESSSEEIEETTTKRPRVNEPAREHPLQMQERPDDDVGVVMFTEPSLTKPKEQIRKPRVSKNKALSAKNQLQVEFEAFYNDENVRERGINREIAPDIDAPLLDHTSKSFLDFYSEEITADGPKFVPAFALNTKSPFAALSDHCFVELHESGMPRESLAENPSQFLFQLTKYGL